MNAQEVTLDVTKRPQISPVLYLGQGDRNGTTLRASIYDDGAQLSLSGKSVRFAMRSPNGQAYYEVNGTVSGNVATFQINEEYAASIAGVTDVAYVEVLEGSTVVCSTNRFRVVVLESAQEGADPEQAYSNGIMEAIDEAEDAAADARDAAEEAREAAGGTIPLMSPIQRGGAKLGSGLHMDGDALNLGPLTDSGSGASVQTDGSGIFGVTGEGFAHQDGTPTPSNPQEIRVARGRNLLDETVYNMAPVNNVIGLGSNYRGMYAQVVGGKTYTVSRKTVVGNRFWVCTTQQKPADGVPYEVLFNDNDSALSVTVSVPSGYNWVFLYLANDGSSVSGGSIQLELGTQATPYVPYGHIGLDITANGQTTTTPIPLPAKGFLGALPDGTKDTLSIDSAGGVVVGNATKEIILSGSESWAHNATYSISSMAISDGPLATTYGKDALMDKYVVHHGNLSSMPDNSFLFSSKQLSDSSRLTIKDTAHGSGSASFVTWLASNHATLLYPLATPTTESLGFIALPELPEGATVSIPELEAIGVSWFVPGASEIAEHAANVANRLREELAETEEAIADLATRVAVLES